MSNYRRFRIPGATVFITLVTNHRIPFLIQPEARDLLQKAWRYVSKKHPFTTEAVCLLPEHLHMLITLPENDADYSLRIREFKRSFSTKYISPYIRHSVKSASHQNKKEAGLWQRRFWDHIIRDERDFRNHFDYIHFNPVKHGLVDDLLWWEWSSFHRYVNKGVYEKDWEKVIDQNKFRGNFGE
jgi:putative transposase